MTHSYIFTSKRLGFRNWRSEDIEILAAINQDDAVMEFFPYKPTRKESEDFMLRMQQSFDEKGYCYFAVDILDTQECIGFIGLCEQTYLETPASFVDIGWRLKKSSWNKGYATEGALACLAHGFDYLQLDSIYAVAPVINKKSELIMTKIGMQKVTTFTHPKLSDYPNLKDCLLYQKKRS
ncbi:GNAT family N-acetyltransferase [Aquimarina hainanensis]|uniref:GNAT family N-acetyltransferase n=1 Tax=Aquimarina hainanensis TaxID=1578017 RepID=A0ABW5NEN0_9FLAO|nr:GNAT family N-acetyltransferase [Aquimarina sp. TRL1]QKX07419.1 GNAT family N-acetyltransferase [Aquimarina sp. TRL1]